MDKFNLTYGIGHFNMHFIQEVAKFRKATSLSSNPFGSGTQDHAGMIASEDKELYNALNNCDAVEILDALVDRVVFAAGWLLDGGDPSAAQYVFATSMVSAAMFDLPLLEGFNEVMASNMSKVFDPEYDGALEDEQQALIHKHNVGVIYEAVDGGGYVFKVESHFKGSDKSEFPIGKLLKPCTFFEPDLEKVINPFMDLAGDAPFDEECTDAEQETDAGSGSV